MSHRVTNPLACICIPAVFNIYVHVAHGVLSESQILILFSSIYQHGLWASLIFDISCVCTSKRNSARECFWPLQIIFYTVKLLGWSMAHFCQHQLALAPASPGQQWEMGAGQRPLSISSLCVATICCRVRKPDVINAGLSVLARHCAGGQI